MGYDMGALSMAAVVNRRKENVTEDDVESVLDFETAEKLMKFCSLAYSDYGIEVVLTETTDHYDNDLYLVFHGFVGTEERAIDPVAKHNFVWPHFSLRLLAEEFITDGFFVVDRRVASDDSVA